MPDALVKLLLVGFGGGLGSISRYGLTTLAARYCETFPLGTLLANVLGCGIIGVLAFFIVERPGLDPHQRLLLITGFLGGLTTFSSFGYETVAAAHSGDYAKAVINIAANVVLSLVAVWGGWAAARALWT